MRRALGITLPQLASRLGVSRSRVIRIQKDELSGALTISTLKEVAEALNCDLIYAFAPRKPLRQLLEERAKKIAKQKLQTVSHSMTLKDQQAQLEDLINALLSNNPKHLWETN